MLLHVILKSKGLRQKVNLEWQKQPPKQKIRFGAFKNPDGKRCLVGLNFEGRIVTSLYVEGKGTMYLYLKALAYTYAIPVQFLFEQKPFKL